MPEAVEIQPVVAASLAGIFRSGLGGTAPSTASTRRKALAAWLRWADTPAFPAARPLSKQLVAAWMAYMWATGTSYTTARLYLDSLAALYGQAVKEGRGVATDAFRDARALMAHVEATRWNEQPGLAACDALASITQGADGPNPRMNLAADMLRFSLLNTAMPVGGIVAAVKTDLDALVPDAAIVARRHITPARKYIFPLRQGALTPAQARRSAESIIVRMLAAHRVPAVTGIDTLLAGAWLRAGLALGLEPELLLACLDKRTVPGPVPELCGPEPTDEYTRLRVKIAVGHSFVDNPLRWYAMRLRPGVKFDHVVARLEAIESGLRPEQTFYPYREIARRTGKKLTFEQQPFIADVVFFQSPATSVRPLFAQIGDLAWCYTTTGRPGGTYAAIPNSSFLIFQRTIAQFTPEYQIAPAGTLAPRPNERVVVMGGLFSGQTATIRAIDTPNTLYRLNLVGTNGIEWRLSVDPRLLAPAR